MTIKNGEPNASNQRINKISFLPVLTRLSPSSFHSLNPSTQASKRVSAAIALLAAASRHRFETRNASVEDKHEAIDCTIRVLHTVSPALPDLLLK